MQNPKAFIVFEVNDTGQHFAVRADEVRSFVEDSESTTLLTLDHDVHFRGAKRDYWVVAKGSFGETLTRLRGLFPDHGA